MPVRKSRLCGSWSGSLPMIRLIAGMILGALGLMLYLIYKLLRDYPNP